MLRNSFINKINNQNNDSSSKFMSYTNDKNKNSNIPVLVKSSSTATNIKLSRNKSSLKFIEEKENIENKSKILDVSNIFSSSSRETYNTNKTFREYENENQQKRKFQSANKNINKNNSENSPNKTSSEIKSLNEDIESKYEYDLLKDRYGRDMSRENIKNHIKLEKYVKEIEMKEEKIKHLDTLDKLVENPIRPCCNENGCIIY